MQAACIYQYVSALQYPSSACLQVIHINTQKTTLRTLGTAPQKDYSQLLFGTYPADPDTRYQLSGILVQLCQRFCIPTCQIVDILMHLCCMLSCPGASLLVAIHTHGTYARISCCCSSVIFQNIGKHSPVSLYRYPVVSAMQLTVTNTHVSWCSSIKQAMQKSKNPV